VPVFLYKAMDLDASANAGTIVADTPRQARDVLRGRGLTITQIEPVGDATATSFGARRRGRRARGQVTGFIRELATLLKAGIPLLAALRTLSAQYRPPLRPVIDQVVDQVAAGVSLADAMARQAAFFDEMAVSIVSVGEQTGSLDEALAKLADYMDKAQRLRSRIGTALIYPAAVGAVGVAVTLYLMTRVVPDLLSTLAQADRDLPAITMLVKTLSDVLRQWWWALLGGVAAFAAAVRWVLRTERGRGAFDRLLLRIPVLGPLVAKENVSRMAVVMSALLSNGLPFTQAIRVTRRTLGNRVFRRALEDYESAVTAGRDVAAPLASSGVFSPVVVQMLAVGQESGQMEAMLGQLAEAYDQQVDVATQRLTALLEPLTIILLALMVGFVALATILPILEVSHVF